MSKVFLLGAKQAYDTSKQVVKENQIVIYHGMGAMQSRLVVYKVEYLNGSFIYHLIDTETRAFNTTDLLRPLHEQFGIGMYYNALEPEFMDPFEVFSLKNEADYKAKAEQEARQKEQERRAQLQAIGRERLQRIIPLDAKAIIIAELHKDESNSMTDYFGYRTENIIILGFSKHTKDLFSEMRKYASNFEETAFLAEENEEYEHREKYAGGEGYFLGKSRYSGWIVKKERLYGDRNQYIERYALIAGDEANICIRVQADNVHAASDTVTGDFIIVDYSEKALAVFGDTRPIKDQLLALGGRFNPKLSHNGGKEAGWIFSKSKENELQNLLTIKNVQQ